MHSETESQISGQSIKPQLFCSKIPHSGVFGVADYKFEVRFSKNKMAATKWRILFKNFCRICMKLYIRRFSELLISNLKSDFPKTKLRLQNGGHFLKISVGFA